MHDTLSSLVERALTGNWRPLAFFLRDNSRLPGPRANLELANDVGHLLASSTSKSPEPVHALLNNLTTGDTEIAANTPEEFVLLCGVISLGMCAAACPDWRPETFVRLNDYASSSHWRVREGVALAYQHLLSAEPQQALPQMHYLASHGSYLQQRAAIASVAEPPLLYIAPILDAALQLQQIVLERVRLVPANERRNEDFRVLRRTLGYTLSVVTAVSPERGFALMRECAAWNDADIRWILHENMGKKRLAKFVQDRQIVLSLLS